MSRYTCRWQSYPKLPACLPAMESVSCLVPACTLDWVPRASTCAPQRQRCGAQTFIPSHLTTATLTASSPNFNPHDEIGRANNQSPLQIIIIIITIHLCSSTNKSVLTCYLWKQTWIFYQLHATLQHQDAEESTIHFFLRGSCGPVASLASPVNNEMLHFVHLLCEEEKCKSPQDNRIIESELVSDFGQTVNSIWVCWVPISSPIHRNIIHVGNDFRWFRYLSILLQLNATYVLNSSTIGCTNLVFALAAILEVE